MSKRERLVDCKELMAQWDFEKNKLNPEHLTAGSGRKVWWKCDSGHSWKAMIGNRGNGANCPYCAGKKVLIGFNDLKTCNPSLADEWDYKKNKLTPLQVTCGSRVMAHWKCGKGHSWKSEISDRSKGRGCPICNNRKVLAGFNDLQALNPELAKEWVYERNKLLPSQVTPGSEKKAWWKCSKGHFWEAIIHNRSRGSGCPYCNGVLVLAGFNDFQTLKPEIAQEWDMDKNELLPTQVTIMSNKNVWWICEKGHSWKTEIHHRSRGGNCPYCSNQRVLAGFNDLKTLRPDIANHWDYDKNILKPSQVVPGSTRKVWWICDEGHSWEATILNVNRVKGIICSRCAKRHMIEYFNRFKPISPKLLQEWDYDKNEVISHKLTSGSNRKAWWKCDKGHSWDAKICSRSRGRKCPYCTGRLLLPGFNDLQTHRSDLTNEWDYEKNILTPSQVSVGSNKYIWWKCAKGHSWKTTVACRSKKQKRRKDTGSGCPYCAGKKVLPGFNDLKTLNPQLADEWDFPKNILTPSQVTLASGKSVWWKCDRGHSWKAQISSRSVNGNNCPYCSGQKVLAGFNDLETVDKRLADEWDYEKNILKPSQVTRSSNKTVWWKCDRGHSWKAAVYCRTKGSDCPCCLGVVPYIPRCVN